MGAIALFKLLITLITLQKALCADRAVLISQLTKTPCTLLSNSPPLSLGEDVFAAAKISASSAQEIMVSMWIFPLKFLLDTNDLFSIYTASPLLKVASLQFNRSQIRVQGTLKGIPSGEVIFLNQQWNFIRILIKLSLTNGGGYDKLVIQNKSIGYPFLQGPLLQFVSPTGSITSFDRSNLLFNLGFSSMLIQDRPSCSILRYVVVWFNLEDNEWTDSQKFEQSKHFNTNSLLHYDLFYSRKNINKIFSFHPYYNSLSTSLLEQNSGFMSLKPFAFIQAPRIHITEQGGLIISLEIKTYSLLTSQKNLFYIYFIEQFIFQLVQSTQNQIILLPTNLVLFDAIPQKWYQFVILIDYSLPEGTQFSIFVANQVILMNPIFIGVISNLILGIGDSGSTQYLQFDNIRYYSGRFVKETTECLIQVEGDTSDCIICQPGYFLSYEQNKICLPSLPVGSTATRTAHIVDWVRGDCPLNMMHSTLTSGCKCPYQTFIENKKCLKCPSYCRGCTSQINCDKIDPNRIVSSGQCPSNFFDDGFNCIPRTFSIPNRQNTYGRIGDNYKIVLPNSILNLSGQDSFFFCLEALLNVNSTNEYKLAEMIMLSDTLIRIYNKVDLTNNIHRICFLQYLDELKCFQVEANIRIWIGVWMDTSEIIIVVIIKGITHHEVISLPTLVPIFINPILCLGDCDDHLLAQPKINYLIYEVLFETYQYISGMQKPTDFKMDFLKLFSPKSTLSLEFSFLQPVPFDRVLKNKAINFLYSSDFLKIEGSELKVHQLKGLSFKNFAYINISSLSMVQEFALTLSILLQNQVGTIHLFQQQYLSKNFVYYLIPQISREESIIRVLYSSEEQETKLCTIKNNQPTFLAFIQRYSNYEEDYFFLEIEVVTEFCRETLTFSLQIKNIVSERTSQNFHGNIYNNSFLNNIKIFEGNQFYFDYTDTDNCFLYYDLQDMKCLKAKKGYAVFQGSTMPLSDCFQIPGVMRYIYNKFTGECQELLVPFHCAEFDDEDPTCIKCFDLNADPNNLCQCFTECLDKCEKCQDEKSCATCKGTDTTIPDCECPQSQFKTKNYQCSNCAPQCLTCSTISETCLECGVGRINPPKCQCNPQYYDQLKSTSEMCVDITCSKKCNVCEYDPQICVTCGVNRQNPPFCECEKEFVEVNFECIKCPSRYYFNSISNECLPCNNRCAECFSAPNQCTQCDSQQYLFQSECLCQDGLLAHQSNSGEISCSLPMNVVLTTSITNGSFSLIFNFDSILDQINFSQIKIFDVIEIYFYQVTDSSQYKVVPRIEEKSLILEFEFNESVSSLSGCTQFLQPKYFTSSSERKVLDSKYLEINLKFEFGSFVFKKGMYFPSETQSSAVQFIKDFGSGDGSPISILRQLSIIYYVINTLQPSVIFLMVNIRVPPNLYQLHQLNGFLIFPKVEDQGVSLASEQTFSIFGKNLTLNQDIGTNSAPFISRFGLSDSLLISAPITYIQLGLFSILVIGTSLMLFVFGSQLGKRYPKIEKANLFLLIRMISCIEGSMLPLVVLSFNQLQNMNSQYLWNRLSVYTAIYTFIIIAFVYMKIYLVNVKKKKSELQFQLTSKLKNGVGSIYYINSQFCKKFTMGFIAVIIIDFPSLVCYLQTVILAFSLAFTLYLRPYKQLIHNAIKIIGEVSQLIVWLIYAFVFVPVEEQIQNSPTFDDDMSNQYLLAGTICIYCLLIFNGFFLLEFVYSIGILIVNKIRSMQKQKKVQLESRISFQQKELKISELFAITESLNQTQVLHFQNPQLRKRIQRTY